MHADMSDGPLSPVFECRAKEPVMSSGEIATWSRLLAPAGRMAEGDVLCIFHESPHKVFHTLTLPCTQALQVQDGAPRLVTVVQTSWARRREAGLCDVITYGSRKKNVSFRYLATRFNGTILHRREMKNSVHCVLPGGVVTFPKCSDTHYRHLFGKSWSIRHKGDPRDAQAIARRPIFGHVALNKAISNHDRLRQEVLMQDIWQRFQIIWSSLLPKDCVNDLGPAPELPARD